MRGCDPRVITLSETLQACAREIGLDAKTFIEDLKSPVIENELQCQMQRARSIDGYSYPSLLLVINNAAFPIVIDYLDHRTILNEILGVE